MHTYKKGDSVVILNQKLNGRFIVEGTAKVIRTIADTDESYVVEFDDGSRVQRFVDPQAQADAKAFCEQLNERANSAR